MTRFRVIAHRGASARAPENTEAAFARASAMGVTEAETDVRRAADGRLVLWHDGRLRPKVDRDGRAEDYPLELLETFSLAAWFEGFGFLSLHPPKAGWHPVKAPCPGATNLMGLEAYLTRFGRVFHHHIELKGEDENLPDLTLDAVRSHGIRSDCTLTSFHFPHLIRARRLDPTIPLGYLCGGPEDDPILLSGYLDRCAGAGLRQLCLWAGSCSKEISDAAHAAGLELRAWGVATREEMRLVLESGADGMTINWPDALMEELGR